MLERDATAILIENSATYNPPSTDVLQSSNEEIRPQSPFLSRSGSFAMFAAIRRASPRTKDQALLLRLFCVGTGWRLWARSAWRRPNGTPRVVRLLIGNLTGRRFVVIVDLLLLWREYVLPSTRTLRGSVCSH
jgi:hypothetical protein